MTVSVRCARRRQGRERPVSLRVDDVLEKLLGVEAEVRGSVRVRRVHEGARRETVRAREGVRIAMRIAPHIALRIAVHIETEAQNLARIALRIAVPRIAVPRIAAPRIAARRHGSFFWYRC